MKAYELLEQKEWCQGTFAVSKFGIPIVYGKNYKLEDIDKFCMMGRFVIVMLI
mgnify:CR=1 FL=1